MERRPGVEIRIGEKERSFDTGSETRLYRGWESIIGDGRGDLDVRYRSWYGNEE